MGAILGTLMEYVEKPDGQEEHRRVVVEGLVGILV